MAPTNPLLALLKSFAARKALVIFSAVLVAGVAAAAITITYTSPSTISTSVTAAPVQFTAGEDAGPLALSDYVSQYSISTNKTYIGTTVNGIPEATLVVDSFFKLANLDDESHMITLSSANVTNALVTAYTLEIFDASGTLVSTLDMRAASSTVSATATIPAATTYTAKLTLTLASGAGADNVALNQSVTLTLA